jgi:predicted house-cleaning NTP pyrophosphatase (Maf/HAM1 superfamily)
LRQVGARFEIRAADVDETVDGSPTPGEYVTGLALRKARAIVSLCAAPEFAAASANTTGISAVPASATSAVPASATSAVPASVALPASVATPGPVVVLGVDTIVLSPDGELFGKPMDRAEVSRMLRRLSGRWHEVYSGLALIELCESPQAGPSEPHGPSGPREPLPYPTAGDRSAPPYLSRELLRFERTRVKMRPLDETLIERYARSGEPDGKAGAYAIQGLGALLVERVDGCYFNVVGLPLQLFASMLSDWGYALL